MEKKPPILNFVIPKKPRLDPPKQPPPATIVSVPEKFEIRTATREEYSTVIGHVTRNRVDRDTLTEKGWKCMEVINIKVIQNSKLETRFNLYKKRMEVNEESWGYRVVHDVDEENRIAKEGLRTSLDAIPDIGDPAQGVVVYQSPATAHADRLIYDEIPIKMIMFRTVRGKAKEYSLGVGNVAPTKKYNCHVPSRSSIESDFNQLALEHQLGAVYHYEFIPGSENVSKVPSMLLPHAIITFKKRESTNQRLSSDTKINSYLRQFKLTEDGRHSFTVNGNMHEATILLPNNRMEYPFIMQNHCATPVVQCVGDIAKFPVLKALRTTHFGKILTSESVSFDGPNTERSSATYLLLQPKTGFSKTLQRLGRFLVWTHQRWTVFYFPSGRVASEFGFPFKQDILHVIVFCEDLSNGSHNQLIGTELSAEFNWSMPDFFTTYNEQNRNNNEQMSRLETNKALSIPIHPSLLKAPKKGILRQIGTASKGTVKFNEDRLVESREIERRNGEAVIDSTLSFEAKRKEAERLTPQQLKETEGTNALFRGAMVQNQANRRGSEEKDLGPPADSINLQTPNVKNLLASSKPTLSSNLNANKNAPRNMSDANRQEVQVSHHNRNSSESTSMAAPHLPLRVGGPPLPHPVNGGPQNRLAGIPSLMSGPLMPRVPPPLPGIRPLMAGIPPLMSGVPPLITGVPPPIIGVPPPITGIQPPVSGVPLSQFPFRPGPSQAPDLRLQRPPPFSSQPSGSSGAATIDFSRPPPQLGSFNIPPPTMLSSVSLSTKSSTSWPERKPTEPETGEAPMDVSFDDKEDEEDKLGKTAEGDESDQSDAPPDPVEENEFLRMALTPAAKPDIDETARVSSSAELLANTLSSLTPSGLEIVMRLKEKKLLETVAKPPVEDTDLRTSAPVPITFSINKPKPSSAPMTNVLGTEDDEEERSESSVPSSQDVDYRKLSGSSQKSCVQEFPKDRDDRLKDIDERCGNIPLPPGLSVEEKHLKKVTDQLQGKLRASGKTRDNVVQSNYNKLLYESTRPRTDQQLSGSLCDFFAPDLSQLMVGPNGLTRSDGNGAGSLAGNQQTHEKDTEPEPIRSPSPIELAEPDADAYVPKTFLNQQKCVIVPIEPKEGYEMYRGDGGTSNRSAIKSPKKHNKTPIDHDKVEGNQSDFKAKKSWTKLIANKRRNSNNEVEDGEIDSDEEKNVSRTSDTSTSGSSDAAAPTEVDLSVPPGIIYRHGGNNFRGRPGHNNRVPQHQPYNGNNHYAFQNGRGRGRGRVYFPEQNRHEQYNYIPKSFDFLKKLAPVVDRSAQNYSIFIDPALDDTVKQADLNMLFSELSKFKKMQTGGVRHHGSVYVHSRAFGMMTDNANKSAKFFHIFNDFKNSHHNVVEILPPHFCDSSPFPRIADLTECMCKVNERKGGVQALFLSHNCTAGSDDGRALAARGIRLMTIKDFFIMFRDWNSS